MPKAVRLGAGLSVLPEFMVAWDLALGRLIRAQPDWSLRPSGVFAGFPAARFRPTKVARFVEM